MTRRVIDCADLFCGAGGTSTGLLQSALRFGYDVNLLALNHNEDAIKTHRRNHPNARHLCMEIDAVNPRKEVPGGRLHLLVASPECTHHSNARGGKPMSDQSRATAWHILRWAEALYIENILIENVREFRDWGPLGANGRPLQSKKGDLYRLFLQSLRRLGYQVEDRLLTAADYGDATTRERLFIQARRGSRKIRWPEPSHLRPGEDSLGLFPDMQRWVPARRIIDWEIGAGSIYERKRPLAPTTMARIFAGLRKFSGLSILHDDGQIQMEPYLVVLRNHGAGRSLELPVPTLAAQGQHIALAQPMILPHQHGSSGTGNVRSVEQPLPTITGSSSDMFLAEPFVFAMNHGKNDVRSYPLDRPLPTITSVDAWGLAQPWFVEYHGERDGQEPRCRSVDRPLHAVGCSNTMGLARPFLVEYYGTGGAHSVDRPLDTITTRDRFALVTPEVIRSGEFDGAVLGQLDIRFRMLQPHELAAAMSFPQDYHFEGTREERVRQIGNAVPVRLAEALCSAVLGWGAGG